MTVLNGEKSGSGGRFQKGNPGGPGRPKGGHIKWCEEFADGEGKKLLLQWARSKNPKAAMQALTLIFHYGKGKPTENHELTGKDGAPITVEVVSFK